MPNLRTAQQAVGRRRRMALSMAARKAITKEMAQRYRRAHKRERTRMLDELEFSDEQRAKPCAISVASIDRLLAGERRRLALRGTSTPKPGSLLRSQIPVRTIAEWDHTRPGFVEVDLVAHDGGSSRGDYCQTLDLTDVASGWTQARAVQNKAQRLSAYGEPCRFAYGETCRSGEIPHLIMGWSTIPLTQEGREPGGRQPMIIQEEWMDLLSYRPQAAGELLPWVHIVISNFKRWQLDAFHGASAAASCTRHRQYTPS